MVTAVGKGRSFVHSGQGVTGQNGRDQQADRSQINLQKNVPVG